jgi:hypothetical protein
MSTMAIEIMAGAGDGGEDIQATRATTNEAHAMGPQPRPELLF